MQQDEKDFVNQEDMQNQQDIPDQLESSRRLAQETMESVDNQLDETADNRLQAEADENNPDTKQEKTLEVDDVKLSRGLLGEDEEIEAAEEVAESPRPYLVDRADDDENEENISEMNPGRGIGIVGLIFSIVSLFIVPFLLGSVGIILGVISAARGSRLGWWAAGVGILSIIISLFVYPMGIY